MKIDSGTSKSIEFLANNHSIFSLEQVVLKKVTGIHELSTNAQVLDKVGRRTVGRYTSTVTNIASHYFIRKI